MVVLQKREVLIAGTKHEINAQTNLQVYSVDQYDRIENTESLKRLKLKHVIIHDPRPSDEDEDEEEDVEEEGTDEGETLEGSEEKPAAKRGRKPNNQQQQ